MVNSGPSIGLIQHRLAWRHGRRLSSPGHPFPCHWRHWRHWRHRAPHRRLSGNLPLELSNPKPPPPHTCRSIRHGVIDQAHHYCGRVCQRFRATYASLSSYHVRRRVPGRGACAGRSSDLRCADNFTTGRRSRCGVRVRGEISGGRAPVIFGMIWGGIVAYPISISLHIAQRGKLPPFKSPAIQFVSHITGICHLIPPAAEILPESFPGIPRQFRSSPSEDTRGPAAVKPAPASMAKVSRHETRVFSADGAFYLDSSSYCMLCCCCALFAAAHCLLFHGLRPDMSARRFCRGKAFGGLDQTYTLSREPPSKQP